MELGFGVRWIGGRVAKEQETQKKKRSKWIELVTTLLAVGGFALSMYNTFSVDETSPLRYNVQTEVVSWEEDKININIFMKVQNGAIGDIRIFDYQDGEIRYLNKKIQRKITKNTWKKNRTFSFELSGESDNPDEHITALYVWVNGWDGSKNLDLILYRVNKTDSEQAIIVAQCYTVQDLSLLEMHVEKQAYKEIIEDYRELVDILY